MNLTDMNTTAVAAIIAAVGAVLVKVIEKWASNRNESFNEGERIRKELRDEIESMKDDVTELKREANEWRQKYWTSVHRERTDEYRIEELETEIKQLHKILKDRFPDSDN
jgi:peptidoglycan hydrolase CwlO-like protein